jgi:hypothetical protein
MAIGHYLQPTEEARFSGAFSKKEKKACDSGFTRINCALFIEGFYIIIRIYLFI